MTFKFVLVCAYILKAYRLILNELNYYRIMPISCVNETSNSTSVIVGCVKYLAAER